MMKDGVAKEERWINWLDLGLLIVMVAGIVIAIERQQVAWGLIPIALTIILNQIKQRNQQRSQQQQFQNLERLIQNSQSEQESQQINLWKLQKQIEEWQDFLIDFRETHTQNNQTIQEIIAELSQLQSLGEKQTDVESQLENISVTQEQLITDFNQLSQSQDTLSQTVENLTQATEQNLRDDSWEYSLQQTNERISYLHQLQNKQHQNSQQVTQSLQEKFEDLDTQFSELKNKTDLKSSLIEETVPTLQESIQGMTREINKLKEGGVNEENSYRKLREELRIELVNNQQLLEENKAEQAKLKQEISQIKQTTETSENNLSLREEIDRLHSYLKQVTQFLDSVVKRQIEEKNATESIKTDLTEKLEALRSKTDAQTRVEPETLERVYQLLENHQSRQDQLQGQLIQIEERYESLERNLQDQEEIVLPPSIMTQQKIDHLHDCLEQLTELLGALAERQTEVSQTLKNHVSTLQDQL